MKRLLLGTTSAICLSLASLSHAATTIELQRFFGACDAEYGDKTDVSKAVGECGIITTLINKFEADNPNIDVKVTTVEWPGYDQLNAQLASRSAPDVVSMHYSAISDYQTRNLLTPIDDILESQGIDKSSFTNAALSGAVKEGSLYALPFDNWTMLFHVNLNLMEQADLVNSDGSPVLPTSREEFFEQGEQFKEKTGKPYVVQILANETAAYSRILYTLMLQQNAEIFTSPTHIKINTPEAHEAVEFMKGISDRGLSTSDMDYAAAVSAFSNGGGGIAVNGTWLIGSYDAQSNQPGNALSDGYAVYPVPQLFESQDTSYVDGHGWVMPAKKHDKETTQAIGKLFKFLHQNDYEWARTGHLPAVKSVFEMPEYQSLPHRENIAKIARTGKSLPSDIQRQFAIQDIIGEEVGAAISDNKTIDEALDMIEYRVNDMLENL